jgi:hypothetical protein
MNKGKLEANKRISQEKWEDNYILGHCVIILYLIHSKEV